MPPDSPAIASRLQGDLCWPGMASGSLGMHLAATAGLWVAEDAAAGLWEAGDVAAG